MKVGGDVGLIVRGFPLGLTAVRIVGIVDGFCEGKDVGGTVGEADSGAAVFEKEGLVVEVIVGFRDDLTEGITDNVMDGVQVGEIVGDEEGNLDGTMENLIEGNTVGGDELGLTEGLMVGDFEILTEVNMVDGIIVGFPDGFIDDVGTIVGFIVLVGAEVLVGFRVGDTVGLKVGSKVGNRVGNEMTPTEDFFKGVSKDATDEGDKMTESKIFFILGGFIKLVNS
mmetsp:Transcript_8671/g.12081  ORF Transcript_8671/g.12081 Transcript_8671/m.12081 type:complete len:225 (-) Transcript_8671:208-882(-)